METSDPFRTEANPPRSARDLAAHHVYDAECALHDALQAARGASGAESDQCDRWVAAAYAHLHLANLEYLAATTELDGRRAA